ncbi:uncharacterized protein LOC101222109 isoform X2 [Cucumis sativus]|uniref:uncharacterized protein LOC101222109 isoform X2 n=1 Tax=Cucumis sativus TaxID=3659 RepID=UPI0012F4B455|nr:uncharacterized protein LOC101222109 isoform X2 [Cucumis sativus]
MLDGILGRGFTSKCKSLIKLTKSRIDVIRRKKKATLKFLKKDIADLLANGLDINAYGRAEGLLVELTISSCYDFVEQSCDTVLQHLPIMQKQRECPDECCEAIASLMFAAARFSDLPELRELRQIFQERFGTSLEHLENQKFVENLASKPSTLEKKVQLLQDIALEFSIKWDSVGFEKRMSTPPAYAKGVPKDQRSYNAVVDKSSHAKEIDPRVGKDGGVSYKENFEHANGRHRFVNPSDSTISGGKEPKFQVRQELPGHGHENRVYDKEETPMEFDGRLNHYGEKKGSTVSKHEARNGTVGSSPRIGRMGSSSSSEVPGDADNGLVVHNGRGRTVPDYLKSPYNIPGPPISKHEAGNGMMGSAFRTSRMGSSSSSEVLGDADDRPVVHNARERTVPNILKSSPYNNPGLAPSDAGLQLKSDIKEPSSVLQGKVEEDKQSLKPSYNSILPPPYVKANSRRKDHRSHSELLRTGHDNNCVSTDPQKPVKSEITAPALQLEPGHPDHERQVTSPIRSSSRGGEMDHVFGTRIPPDALPKPRSVRRRHHKPRSSHSVDDNAEDIRMVRKKSRSSRRRDDKRGLQLLVDEQENERDEEERIIDKLLIHYSKKPSSFEPGKMRRKPKNLLAPENGAHAAKSPLNLISRDGADEQADSVPPARSASLPREHNLGLSEATKVFTRAASFQPDRSSAAKHVHPKLPDYDDLAARFAALRGR